MQSVTPLEAAPSGARSPQAVLHDVKNLLSAASSLVSRLRLTLGTSELVDAQALAGQLAGTVEDAVAVATGAHAFRSTAQIDALTYVAEHAGALASLFPHPASLTVSLRPDPAGARVTMHPTDLLRVLTNLVKNSAQACGELGVAKISVTTIQTLGETPVIEGSLQPGFYVAVVVRDSGHGFPRLGPRVEALRDSREPRGRKRLGLAVVRELLEEVGGGLALGNHPAGGAEAQAWMPLATV